MLNWWFGIGPEITEMQAHIRNLRGSIEQRRNATSALLNYALSTTHQNAIRNANGLPPLVASLSDHDVQVRENAAGALSRLALNRDNQDAIRRAEGITPLIALLNSNNNSDLTERYAIEALGRLAYKHLNNQNAIRSLKGIASLITAMERDNHETLNQAVIALKNLARNNSENQVDMIVGGVFPRMIQLSEGGHENAAILLELLASSTAPNHLIGGLVALLKFPEPIGRASAIALSRLAAVNQNNQDAIREADAIVPLIALLNFNNTTVLTKQYAIEALGCLACNNLNNQNAIRLAQGINALITALANAEGDILDKIVLALKHLASDNLENQAEMTNGDVLPYIRPLAVNGNVDARILLDRLGQPMAPFLWATPLLAAQGAAPFFAAAAVPEPQLDSEHPEEFLCPISLSLMEDPVIVCTGHTFERTSIVDWFARGTRINPVTGDQLANTNLVPNFALRDAIDNYRSRNLQFGQFT